MMVVGDNLGEKEEKIEEAALAWAASASPSHHFDYHWHPFSDEQSSVFENILIILLKTRQAGLL